MSSGDIYREWLSLGHKDGDEDRCANCDLGYESFELLPLSCEQNKAQRRVVMRAIDEAFTAPRQEFWAGVNDRDYLRHSWWNDRSE